MRTTSNDISPDLAMLKKVYLLHRRGHKTLEIASHLNISRTLVQSYLRVIRSKGNVEEIARVARQNHWREDRVADLFELLGLVDKEWMATEQRAKRIRLRLFSALPGILTDELVSGSKIWRSSGVLGNGPSARGVTFTDSELLLMTLDLPSLDQQLVEHQRLVERLYQDVTNFRGELSSIGRSLDAAKDEFDLEDTRTAVYVWFLSKIITPLRKPDTRNVIEEFSKSLQIDYRHESTILRVGAWSSSIAGKPDKAALSHAVLEILKAMTNVASTSRQLTRTRCSYKEVAASVENIRSELKPTVA